MISSLTSSPRGLPGAGRVVPQQDLLALVGGRLRRRLLLPVLHDVRERQLLVRIQGLRGRKKIIKFFHNSQSKIFFINTKGFLFQKVSSNSPSAWSTSCWSRSACWAGPGGCARRAASPPKGVPPQFCKRKLQKMMHRFWNNHYNRSIINEQSNYSE